MGIKRKRDWKERKRIEEKRWEEKNLRNNFLIQDCYMVKRLKSLKEK